MRFRLTNPARSDDPKENSRAEALQTLFAITSCEPVPLLGTHPRGGLDDLSPAWREYWELWNPFLEHQRARCREIARASLTAEGAELVDPTGRALEALTDVEFFSSGEIIRRGIHTASRPAFIPPHVEVYAVARTATKLGGEEAAEYLNQDLLRRDGDLGLVNRSHLHRASNNVVDRIKRWNVEMGRGTGQLILRSTYLTLWMRFRRVDDLIVEALRSSRYPGLRGAALAHAIGADTFITGAIYRDLHPQSAAKMECLEGLQAYAIFPYLAAYDREQPDTIARDFVFH